MRTIVKRLLAVLTVFISACTGDKATAPDVVGSISISNATNSLQYGQTVQLTASVRSSSGNSLTGRTVTWSSSNDAVATVSSSGLVTAGAVRGGTAETVTITATSEGKSASSSLSVAPIPVATVSNSLAEIAVYVGQTVQLGATAKDLTGAVVTGRAITWSSSSAAIATISAQGLVTAVRPGTTLIVSSIEGKIATTNIIVAVVPVSTVSISPSSASLYVGQTLQLTASAKDSAGGVLTGRAVNWSNATPTIAAINTTGLVSAVSPGTATITATVEGMIATIKVVVTLVPVKIVSISPALDTLINGQNAQYYAELRDSIGGAIRNRAATWKSSAPQIITVDSDGKVTAIAPGTAKLTAIAEGIEGILTISVVEYAPPFDRLARHLDTISIISSQSANDSATAIFLTSSREKAEVWENFLVRYLSTKDISYRLADFLYRPTFWGGQWNSLFYRPIFTRAIGKVLHQDLAFAKSDLRRTSTDSILSNRTRGLLNLLNWMIVGGTNYAVGARETAPLVIETLASLLNRHSDFVRTVGDTSTAFAVLRRSVVLAARGDGPPTTERAEYIADALQMSAIAREILKRTGTVLFSNYELNWQALSLESWQEQDIADLLNIMNDGWINVGAIAFNQTFNRPFCSIGCYFKNGFAPSFGFAKTVNPGTNTSTPGTSFNASTADTNAMPGIAYIANAVPGKSSIEKWKFPNGIERSITTFRSVINHELNHDVDLRFATYDPWYLNRRDQLIAKAGDTPSNYLRDDIRSGFFSQSKGEFWSSMMQRWLLDSEGTIKQGITAFRSGRPEPLNQALFAVDVWVRKTGKAAFFLDTSRVSRINVNVEKDQFGQSVAWTLNGTSYRFTRNAQGDVLSILSPAN
jgi:uncharacterized protein YjdB